MAKVINKNSRPLAIKVIKNKPNYEAQGKIEIKILKKLNTNDPTCKRVVKLHTAFKFRKHLFLVFELLGDSIFDLIKQQNYKGFALSKISMYTKQILEGLMLAEQLRIIHCDLKPENILVYQ